MAYALFLAPKLPLPLTLFSTSTNYLPPSHVPLTIPSYRRRRCHDHQNQYRIPVIPSSSSFRNGSTPETECPVPPDQQPINEYQNLSTSYLFSWAFGDAVEYSSRLFVTGLAFTLLVGLPISSFGSIGSEPEPVKLVLGSVATGLFAVTLAVLRMYLGWAYVGNRLLSATVEYEETGWYDGQIWVKTAEVLARDRLLGSFQVKPLLSRLKNTLIGLAASLFICFLLLTYSEGTQQDPSRPSNQAHDRVIAGVYSDNSARSFEPDAFSGDSGFP
ncbi:hypothetical protein Nepgr_000949 [Nepenthes gracilis]|uniref:Uncharacterized protein n=1 Tax=Nepenthes gracilis TaxID=150966 RepID=A0AAD3P591_NEPGR|nr:hypothetical protein Nepgr_000949 [Nepenthes gracilis]